MQMRQIDDQAGVDVEFDACAVASSMTVFSRMTVALAALGRDKA